MTIHDLLEKFPNQESDILLAHVLKQSKEFLYLNPRTKVSAAQEAKYEILTKKRMEGVPIAYLTGVKEFYGLAFKVNRSVLIPRPESEWLVESTLEIIKKKFKKPIKPLTVADVGTGSGCLAITLAVELSKLSHDKHIAVDAYDISMPALHVAKSNAKTHQAKVKFIQNNLLSGVKKKYDLIIANLPYVPYSDYLILKEGLKYEPKLALTDKTDDFIIIQEFLKQAVSRLKPKGIILIETDPASIAVLKKTIRLLYTNKKIQVTKDLNKLERFIKIA